MMGILCAGDYIDIRVRDFKKVPPLFFFVTSRACWDMINLGSYYRAFNLALDWLLPRT